jgi:hypothetical protein
MKRIFDFATLRLRNTRRNNHGETAQPRSTVKKLISTALAVLLMTLFSSYVFADVTVTRNDGGTSNFGFTDRPYGYDEVSRTMTITNNSSSAAIEGLTIGIISDGGDKFVISDLSDDDIATSGTVTFNFTLKQGLPARAEKYKSTLIINYTGLSEPIQLDFVSVSVVKADLKASDFTGYYPVTTATYDGEEHRASTYPSAKSAGIGEFKQKYRNQTTNKIDTVAVDAGIYDVIVVAKEGANFNPTGANGVTIGTLKISQAVPTAADLAFPEGKGVYNGAMYYIYSDDIIAFPTPVAAEGVKGISAGGILYDGSQDPPTKPGKYAVTVDVSGLNYAFTNDLLVGYLIISDAVTPPIVREVTVIGSEYFASDRTGSFIVNSGGNLTLTLTPVKPLPEGQELKVSTNRHIIADDEGGLFVTANPNGTYTVFIPQIKEAVEVTISTVATTIGTGSEVIADATRAWSAARTIYIAAGADDTQANIYNVTGVLVKTIRLAAGETIEISLPAGIYIVTTGKKTFKILN